VTGCRATPDDLDFKTQKTEAKIQNIRILSDQAKRAGFWLSGHPDDLDLKTIKIEIKIQNERILSNSA
jgi:hypothetical protein